LGIAMSLLQNLKFTARLLRKNPALAKKKR
jgi:hypothetical protein